MKYGIYVQTAKSGIISVAVQTYKTKEEAEAEAQKLMERIMTKFHLEINFVPPSFTLVVKPYHVNK